MILHYISSSVCQTPLRLSRVMRPLRSSARRGGKEVVVMGSSAHSVLYALQSTPGVEREELPTGLSFGVSWRELLSQLHPEAVEFHGLLSRRALTGMTQTHAYGAPYRVDCQGLGLPWPWPQFLASPALWLMALPRLRDARQITLNSAEEAHRLEGLGVRSELLSVAEDPLRDLQPREMWSRSKLLVGFASPQEPRGEQTIVRALHSMQIKGASNHVRILYDSDATGCHNLAKRLLSGAPEVDSEVCAWQGGGAHDDLLRRADVVVVMSEGDAADEITERALALATPIVAIPGVLSGQLIDTETAFICSFEGGNFYQSVFRVLQSEVSDRQAWGLAGRELVVGIRD